MKIKIRLILILALTASVPSAACFAQSAGEAIYKSRCLNCHGNNGLANTGVGKAIKIKPVTDPAVMKLTRAEMIRITQIGNTRMQAYKGDLTEEQIKDSVDYFRSFIK